MPVHFEKATREDAIYLAPRLRAEDIIECIGWGHTPLASLLRGVQEGLDTRVAYGDDGHALAMFGLGVVHPHWNLTTIWMLAARGVLTERKYQRAMLRYAGPLINEWNAEHPMLGNAVHSLNTVHIQWLERMGFLVNKTYTVTSERGHVYYPFVRYKNV